MSVKEHKVKNTCGCPLKTQRSRQEDNGMVENKSVANQNTLRWAGLKVENGCKNPAIAHGRVMDDVEKKNVNEEQQQNEEH